MGKIQTREVIEMLFRYASSQTLANLTVGDNVVIRGGIWIREEDLRMFEIYIDQRIEKRVAEILEKPFHDRT